MKTHIIQARALVRRAAALSLAIAAIAATSCSTGTPTNAGSDTGAHSAADDAHADEVELTESRMRNAGVTIGTAEERPMAVTVKVEGVTALNPQEMAEVTPLAGGVLQSLLVREGHAVAKGQVVAYIDMPDAAPLQRDYLQAVAELDAALAESERQQKLRNAGAGVERNRLRAEADLAAARGAASSLAAQLRQLGIAPEGVRADAIATRVPLRSPIAGRVGRVLKPIGAYVDPQQPVMSVADNSRMHVDLNVYERDLRLLRPGQRVRLTLTQTPDLTLEALITDCDAAFADEAGRVVAHASIASAPATLIPGMSVTGDVIVDSRPAIAIPAAAVAESEGTLYIFIHEGVHDHDGEPGHAFRRVPVTVKTESDGYAEVVADEPLAAGTPVAVSGAQRLSSMLGAAASHDH